MDPTQVYCNRKDLDWFLEMAAEARTFELVVTSFPKSKDDIPLILTEGSLEMGEIPEGIEF